MCEFIISKKWNKSWFWTAVTKGFQPKHVATLWRHGVVFRFWAAVPVFPPRFFPNSHQAWMIHTIFFEIEREYSIFGRNWALGLWSRGCVHAKFWSRKNFERPTPTLNSELCFWNAHWALSHICINLEIIPQAKSKNLGKDFYLLMAEKRSDLRSLIEVFLEYNCCFWLILWRASRPAGRTEVALLGAQRSLAEGPLAQWTHQRNFLWYKTSFLSLCIACGYRKIGASECKWEHLHSKK